MESVYDEDEMEMDDIVEAVKSVRQSSVSCWSCGEFELMGWTEIQHSTPQTVWHSVCRVRVRVHMWK